MGFALRVFLKLVFEVTVFLCWLKTLLFWNPRASVRLWPRFTARENIPWVVGFEGRTINQAGAGTGHLQLANWIWHIYREHHARMGGRKHRATFGTCNDKGAGKQGQEVKKRPILSQRLRVRCDTLGWDQPKYHPRLKPTWIASLSDVNSTLQSCGSSPHTWHYRYTELRAVPSAAYGVTLRTCRVSALRAFSTSKTRQVVKLFYFFIVSHALFLLCSLSEQF